MSATFHRVIDAITILKRGNHLAFHFKIMGTFHDLIKEKRLRIKAAEDEMFKIAD